MSRFGVRDQRAIETLPPPPPPARTQLERAPDTEPVNDPFPVDEDEPTWPGWAWPLMVHPGFCECPLCREGA